MESEIVIQLVNFYTGRLTQKKVLEVLNISRTTYNRWIKQLPKDKKNSKLIKLVKNLFNENKYRYGYGKISYLVNKLVGTNKNSVQKQFKIII